MCFIQGPSPYRAVNTFHLGYKTTQIMLYETEVVVCSQINTKHINTVGARCGLVVKALRYKPAGRGFDPRLCHWNFSVT